MYLLCAGSRGWCLGSGGRWAGRCPLRAQEAERYVVAGIKDGMQPQTKLSWGRVGSVMSGGEKQHQGGQGEEVS